MIRRFTLLAAVCLTAPAALRAQTNETYNGTLGSLNGPGSVVYNPFHVFGDGTFSIFTIAPNQDAEIYLFSGLPLGGQLIGNGFLGLSDDGCSFLQCGSSAFMPGPYTGNSILNLFLGVGDYTVAFGNFALSESDARNGENTGGQWEDGATGDFQIRLTSDDGTAENYYNVGIDDTSPAVAVTPEPVTMTLMATGLVAMAGVGRRRRKAA